MENNAKTKEQLIIDLKNRMDFILRDEEPINDLIKLFHYKNGETINSKHILSLVKRFNLTMEIEGYGNIVKKQLSDRIHNCIACNFVVTRDLNAACNIYYRGFGYNAEIVNEFRSKGVVPLETGIYSINLEISKLKSQNTQLILN